MLTISNCKVPAHYENYVKANKEKELILALESSARRFRKLTRKISKKKADYAYAEGKWTIKELVQHVIDTERVFCYRALSFARMDSTPLPGFDENSWAAHAKASDRSWKELLEEFQLVRAATIAMFDSFDDDQLLKTGISNNHESNVIGLGFVSAGHVMHHCNILKERYLSE